MNPETTKTGRSRFLRVVWVFRVVALATCMCLAAGFVAAVGLSPTLRHTRLLKRLADPMGSRTVVLRAQGASYSEVSREERTREWVLRALQNAMWNVAYYREDCGDEQLKRIADRIEETGGTELDSAEGCLRIWLEIEEACPKMRDYAWVVMVRDMQSKGDVMRRDEFKQPVVTP
jgi:hypothetical protein